MDENVAASLVASPAEPAVEHVVFFTSAAGADEAERFPGLGTALRRVETLVNDEDVADAAIFALTPVRVTRRQRWHVEADGSPPAATSPAARPAASGPAATDALAPAPSPATVLAAVPPPADAPAEPRPPLPPPPSPAAAPGVPRTFVPPPRDLPAHEPAAEAPPAEAPPAEAPAAATPAAAVGETVTPAPRTRGLGLFAH